MDGEDFIGTSGNYVCKYLPTYARRYLSTVANHLIFHSDIRGTRGLTSTRTCSVCLSYTSGYSSSLLLLVFRFKYVNIRSDI